MRSRKVFCIIKRPDRKNRGVEPPNDEARAKRAWFDGRRMNVELEDGRTVEFPPGNMRWLRDATDDQLVEVQIATDGVALRWVSLDEDLTVEDILTGRWRP